MIKDSFGCPIQILILFVTLLSSFKSDHKVIGITSNNDSIKSKVDLHEIIIKMIKIFTLLLIKLKIKLHTILN